jgi:hypothetical protein
MRLLFPDLQKMRSLQAPQQNPQQSLPSTLQYKPEPEKEDTMTQAQSPEDLRPLHVILNDISRVKAELEALINEAVKQHTRFEVELVTTPLLRLEQKHPTYKLKVEATLPV